MHLNLLEVADLTGILEKRLGPSQQMPNFGMMPMGMMPQQGEDSLSITLIPYEYWGKRNRVLIAIKV